MLGFSTAELKHAQPDYPVEAARSATYLLSMKLGFICPQVPGHLNPITTLARHLQMHKHEVVFLYSSGSHGTIFITAASR